jgi:hypothetical protein
VLDAELDRAEERAHAEAASARPPSPTSDATFWPAPMPAAERPSPESQTFLSHPDRHDVELGANGFLMSTQTFGPVAGGGATVVVEVNGGWFLRPGLLAGGTIGQSGIAGTLLSTHMAACKRVPGNYLQHRGIQADFCLDSDVGMLLPAAASRVSPFVTLGPSVGLRGELGNALSVELRGVGGWAFAQTEALARVELGLTWRVR